MLVNGKWTSDWHPVQAQDGAGRFVRQTSSFRNWVTPDGAAGPTGEAGFKAETGRYHLYVALICPWASRALIARKLKGLEDVITVSVVEPFLTDQGWKFGDFDGADADPLFAADYMHQIYTKADPQFTGRATVPVLWDKKQNVMVNNESADILRMLNTGFGDLARSDFDLYPTHLAAEIDALAPWMYNELNNGVYKAGFASSQAAYEEAATGVFAALDVLDTRLSDGRAFLLGDQLTEADIRLFVTSLRFDAAYHGLFKTNWKRIADYAHVQKHLERMLRVPGLADTVNLTHVLSGYYSIKALNPSGIIPRAPSHVAQLVEQVRATGRAA
ncbi:Glutathionyl-hydroquinone reductase YqjG [Tritonibacter multivorans]|uniref:Glutathionyl-hydroquinone reductase YqjG n=1 Tax=Tritonibacter multivorans TaxID=928856 RepID=A0A0P1GB02_9RHOB|nr:glutathione S-transferase C-terminal domain-containing protein [Tritonibacter multivorans]MDA7422014.1 glutathione S-transferase C-terminal domain-containing protein [Tritonibacter multivorans]CUH78659.1 Glutathionyl-hydroquinone reductase YqjG [Tritonibacter multivorans]SFD66512.1 putative glutathione S-transferase [Tritonibacter multivorans]